MFSNRTNWKLTLNPFTVAHQQALREGRELLDLTISNPTRAGFDYQQTTILDALRNSRSLDYDPQPKGLSSAREAAAEYYSGKCGAGALAREVDRDSVILTTSTSEGYS